MGDKKKPKSGRRTDRLKLEGDWPDALKKALGAVKPVEGWPKSNPAKAKKPK